MIILLTGCINPNGMSFTTLSNIEERKRQYVNAIRFYLTSTKHKIVFVENSGTNISSIFQDINDSNRFEYITFYGNQNKERGKGYGECEIIEFALKNSKIITSSKDQLITKITGRLIVKNINTMIFLHSIFHPQKTVCFSINSDLSFPDSRFIIAPYSFFTEFLKTKEKINDSYGYYFEHALLETIKNLKDYAFTPFLFIPRIEGFSGTTSEQYHANRRSLIFNIKYAKYAIWQRKRFYKKYRNNE